MSAVAEIDERELTDAFEAFAAKNPEPLGPSRAFLGGYYSPETLDGDRAKLDFVLPDRQPSSWQ